MTDKLTGRPLAALALSMFVMLAGVLAMRELPLQLTPDVAPRTIDVRTQWPGADAASVESELLIPQEQQLVSLPFVASVVSDAAPGNGTIRLEIDGDTDLERAMVDVEARLMRVSRRPFGALPPLVESGGYGDPPLAFLRLVREDGTTVDSLRTWAERTVVPAISRVRGVGSVEIHGGRRKRIDIDVDVEKLYGTGTTLDGVEARISRELGGRGSMGARNEPGMIELGATRYQIRPGPTFESLGDLEALDIGVDARGNRIQLRDVARVQWGLEPELSVAVFDGQPALALVCYRDPGANVLDTVDALGRAIEELGPTLREQGVRIEIVNDQSEYIDRSLRNVVENLAFGTILVVLAVFGFLRSFTAGWIVGFSIPVCLLGTLAGLLVTGRTLNVVSLATSSFAVGMVVDNAIVAVEGFAALRTAGHSPAAAAGRAVRDLVGPLTGSTLTTVAALVPIFFWDRAAGELLRDASASIVFAVSLSLLYAVFVAPALMRRFWVGAAASNRPRRLDGLVGAMVGWIVATRRRSVVVAIGSLVSTGAAMWMLAPSLDYMPSGNRNAILGVALPTPGSSALELRRLGDDFSRELEMATDRHGATARNWFFVGDGSQVIVGAFATQIDGIQRLVTAVRESVRRLPGVTGGAAQAGLFGRIGAGERSIAVAIRADDFAAQREAAGWVQRRTEELLPGSTTYVSPNPTSSAKELRVRASVPAAARLASPSWEIERAAQAYLHGVLSAQVSISGDVAVDVVLHAVLAADTSSALDSLSSYPFMEPDGAVVPMGTVLSVETVSTPTRIHRVDAQRAVEVLVSIPAGIALDDAVETLRRELLDHGTSAADSPPPGVAFALVGHEASITEIRRELSWSLVATVVVTYLVLVVSFASLRLPLAAMALVPVAAVGGLCMLASGSLATRLDLLSAMGFAILTGVVVNNGILIIDGAESRTSRGEPLSAALVAAVQERLRPIVMTTGTTLAGVAPMVASSGAGSELYAGISAVVLGGLSLAGVVCIVLTPAFVTALSRAPSQAAVGRIPTRRYRTLGQSRDRERGHT